MRVSYDGLIWYIPNDMGNAWSVSSNWGPYIPNTFNFPIGNSPGLVPVFVGIMDSSGNIGNATSQITYVTEGNTPSTNDPKSGDQVNVGDIIIDRNGYYIDFNGTVMKVVQATQTTLKLKGLSHVTGIRFSSNNGVTWTPYESVNPNGSEYSKSITFDYQGVNTLLIQLKSSDGIVSEILKQHYLVDYTAPTIQLTTANNANATSNSSIPITVLAEDNVSPKKNLLYSLNKTTWSKLPIDGVIQAPITKGSNTIIVYIVDDAGNLGKSLPLTVWGL